MFCCLQEVKEEEPAQQEEEEPGMWEESFKTFHDSKPYGENHGSYFADNMSFLDDYLLKLQSVT